jgi:transcriptional regulator with XRE-family HTH domain
MQSLAERLHWARSVAGLSTRALASKAGVASGYPSAIELDQVKNPGLDSLTKIAAALEIEVGWLMLGVGQKPSERKLRKLGRQMKGAA